MGKQFLDEISRFIGLALIMLILFGVVALLIYGLIGSLSDRGIHLLATGLVFVCLGAFVLGLKIGSEHVRGVERGLDIKLSAAARDRDQRAAARTAAPPGRNAAQWNELLPTVDGKAAIVRRTDNDTSPIEM